MFKLRLSDIAKRISVSIFLSAAVLSIASVESLWHDRNAPDLLREETQKNLRVALDAATEKATVATDPTQAERLRFTFTQDEFGNVSPFGQLNTIAPLTQMMNKGVVGFNRQAYRSPQYKEEVGYDLLQYEIEHKDGSKSYVLAYLERPLEGNPDELVPVVIVMQGHQGAAKQSLFRSGQLVEQGDLSLAQVQSLMTQKLNSGVPFFSVAR
ncbi:MAG: hypothetical protein KF799_11355 [Bdellovibrionales bacterium]|nr:hypothetical protein [Bdellovibrionales bacterium]